MPASSGLLSSGAVGFGVVAVSLLAGRILERGAPSAASDVVVCVGHGPEIVQIRLSFD